MEGGDWLHWTLTSRTLMGLDPRCSSLPLCDVGDVSGMSH